MYCPPLKFDCHQTFFQKYLPNLARCSSGAGVAHLPLAGDEKGEKRKKIKYEPLQAFLFSMKSSELLDEARGINANLERSRQGLTWSVMQTEAVASVIKRDGEIIADTLNEHSAELRAALESTRHRLQRIQKAEEYEQIALWSAIVFFTLVVCFILCSRFRIFVIVYDYFYCLLLAHKSQDPSHVEL